MALEKKNREISLIMKHPVSSVVAAKKSSLVFCTVKNNIQVYDQETEKLVFQWTDTVDTDYAIKKKFENIVENPTKKQKIPKIPTPGPGAPRIFNDVRNLYLSSSEKFLVASTNSDKAALVFEVSPGNDPVLKLIKRQPFPKRPSLVALSKDEKNVILGDKFGDVYSIPIEGEVIQDLSEPALTQAPGKLPTPILGHVSMLTSVILATDSTGAEKVLTADRDEHIRVSNYPDAYIIDKFCFGHKEFVAHLLIPLFDRTLLISAGGDSFVGVTKWQDDDKFLYQIDLSKHIKKYLTDAHKVPERWAKGEDDYEFSVAGMALSGRFLVVLVEHTSVLLVFKFEDGVSFVGAVENEEVITCVGGDGDRVYFGVDGGVKTVKTLDLNSLTVKDTKFEGLEIGEESPNPVYFMAGLRKRSEH